MVFSLNYMIIKKIVFSIVDGDITTKNSTKPENIREKIGECIKIAMQKDKFLKIDIDMVIHLVDTDGVYIPNLQRQIK